MGVCFNAEWLPYVIGGLLQLAQPSSWNVSPSALQALLRDVQDLLDEFGQAGACVSLTFRFTSACVLQYSLDGGTTWTDTPGWSTFASTCFTGPAGPTGPTGPTGPAGPAGGYAPPTTPPNPAGTPTAQHACNIAGYLANSVIQASVNQAVSSITAGRSEASFMSALFGILFVMDPLVDLMILAGDGLFNVVTAGPLSDWSSAASDGVLWSNVTCAIYEAIKATGYVTSSNFSAAETNIRGISYTHAEVISGIGDYWHNLSITGIQQLQDVGALAVYDCSGCASPPSDVALDFGSAFVASCTLNTDLSTAGDMTIGGWWHPVSPGTALGYFISMGYDGTDQAQANMYYDATNGYLSAFWNNPTGSFLDLHSTTHVKDATHLVAMTKSGSTLKLYVDGNVVATGTLPSGPFSHAGGATIIGSQQGHSNILGGDLWRWAYYNLALTDAQHAAWFAAGHFAPPVGAPANIWKFDEGTGLTVHDSVGTETGTLSGDVTWTTHT